MGSMCKARETAIGSTPSDSYKVNESPYNLHNINIYF